MTLALLGFVVSNVSLENLWAELQGVHLGWYLLGLGISVVSIAINAFKWRLLLLYLGYRRSYGYLFTLQLYGILFNNIFPQLELMDRHLCQANKTRNNHLFVVLKWFVSFHIYKKKYRHSPAFALLFESHNSGR